MESTCGSGLIATLSELPVPWVLGHRGMGKNGLGTGSVWGENTLRSLEAASCAGVAAVECDVRATSDGAVILLHDETLRRTAEPGADESVLTASVSNLSLKQVLEVKVSEAESSPLFQDALVLALQKGTGVFVELKDDRCTEEVARLLQVRDGASRLVNVISFNVDWILRARELLPSGTDLGWLCRSLSDDWEEQAARMGITNLGVQFQAITRAHVEAASRIGVAMWVWNPATLEDVQHVVRLGVAGMGSDDPAASLRWVDEASQALNGNEPTDQS